MTQVTVGDRYQVVIPHKERKRLGISPRSKMDIVVEGDHLVMYPVAPSGWRGIGKEIADGTDATEYVIRLRKEWEQREGSD